MEESKDYQVYLSEREPHAEDYKGIDRIEIVHLGINETKGNPRETLIRERIKRLRDSGIEIREVDIETNDGDIEGKRIIVGGSLGDNCAVLRRRYLLDNKAISVKVDTSLTSDY